MVGIIKDPGSLRTVPLARDDPEMRAWITHDLAKYGDGLFDQELPPKLKELVLLFAE